MPIGEWDIESWRCWLPQRVIGSVLQTLFDNLGSDEDSVNCMQSLFSEQFRAVLRQTQEGRMPRNARILRLHYGLDPDGKEYTCPQIADMMKLSTHHVWRIIQAELDNLKRIYPTQHPEFADCGHTLFRGYSC